MESRQVVESEQRFCVRFFHINSSALTSFDSQISITYTNSADTMSTTGSTGGGAMKSMEKHMNDLIKSVIGPIFDTLPIYFQRFACACKDQQSL